MGHDPLRDEGHALALRIAQAGVLTEHRIDRVIARPNLVTIAVRELRGSMIRIDPNWPRDVHPSDKESEARGVKLPVMFDESTGVSS
jgi:hypothetical protein